MAEAPVIKKLSQEVVNKIAAGEVIQRPANALKELMENSLDAKSTNIQITVKSGGLKLLQIQDNGTGIRKEDFGIVCERFTTSKLEVYDDLNTISTYGFRGEALASISHVAHLTIISKTADEKCAYKASYVDGKLVGDIKPTAGNQGTQIIVEDLFYNMSIRKRTLRSPAEEYQKIAEVVGKYAIHNADVAFGLKKSGDSNVIKTPMSSNPVDNIRIIYGNTIAKELIEFSIENEAFKFKAKGHMTNVNYSTKKMTFLLFINHRLVDCANLKRCIDQVYTTYLPKNSHPFVYLSLELDSRMVDVNVHPTKHEVHFLNEEQIIEIIVTGLEAKLLGSNNSRAFYTQARLPGVPLMLPPSEKNANKTVYQKDLVRTDSSEQKLEKFFGAPIKVSENAKAKMDTSINSEEFAQMNEEFLRRNESFENKLHLANENNQEVTTVDNKDTENVINLDEELEFEETYEVIEGANSKLKVVNINEEGNLMELEETDEVIEDANLKSRAINEEENFVQEETAKENKRKEKKISHAALISKIKKTDTSLTSVLQLRKEIEDDCHMTMRELFSQHVFVGCVDSKQSLLQHSTKLYLCDTQKILQELFYQIILYNFGNMDMIRFPEPLQIYDLAVIALDLAETGWTPDDGPKEELARRIKEVLSEKGEMLLEYFSMEIDEDGLLKSLPLLLGHKREWRLAPSLGVAADDSRRQNDVCSELLPQNVVCRELTKPVMTSLAPLPLANNYIPDEYGLPMYVLRLATEVNWESEKECFKSFAQETALYYSRVNDRDDKWKWTTEHVLYSAIKDFFLPPKNFVENAAVLEIADLPKLYRVFERC